PLGSPLFPYTTLFRSRQVVVGAAAVARAAVLLAARPARRRRGRNGGGSAGRGRAGLDGRVVGQGVGGVVRLLKQRLYGRSCEARSEEHTSELQSRRDL